MGWSENSAEGIEVNAAGSIEIVAAPVAAKKKYIIGLSFSSPELQANKLEFRIVKKKGADQILIDPYSAVHSTMAVGLGLGFKQLLNDTDESMEVVITANPNNGDLHWTALWADID